MVSVSFLIGSRKLAEFSQPVTKSPINIVMQNQSILELLSTHKWKSLSVWIRARLALCTRRVFRNWPQVNPVCQKLDKLIVPLSILYISINISPENFGEDQGNISLVMICIILVRSAIQVLKRRNQTFVNVFL